MLIAMKASCLCALLLWTGLSQAEEAQQKKAEAFHIEQPSLKQALEPLLQKSRSSLFLFDHFNFHPTFISESFTQDKPSLTVLVSYRPGDKPSAAWSHFVTFHLEENELGEPQIKSVEFLDCNKHSRPCFLPEEVYSVDPQGKLVAHAMEYPMQILDPNIWKKFKEK